MKDRGLLIVGATLLGLGTVALAALAIAAVVNADIGERVAAATGAATTALVIVGGLTTWQNSRLVQAAAEQARVSHEEALASRQLADAAAEQARTSHELAEASRQQAAASESQAMATRALVEEARTDRELEFRPFVTTHVHQQGDHGGRPYVEVAVANIGRGPALNAALAYHEVTTKPAQHRFGSSELFDLGPGESDSYTLYLEEGSAGQAFRRLVDGLAEPALAVGYQDIVGNKYRWATSGGFRRPPETRRKGDEPHLDWSAWQ